ncbi:MAG: AtpZ/AtpI family protein [bacterium]
MTEKKSEKTTVRAYQLFALRIIGDFGAVIALPIIAFILIGQHLDNKYDKSPLFTILSFILASLISAKIIHGKAKKYGREYQNMVDNDK